MEIGVRLDVRGVVQVGIGVGVDTAGWCTDSSVTVVCTELSSWTELSACTELSIVECPLTVVVVVVWLEVSTTLVFPLPRSCPTVV